MKILRSSRASILAKFANMIISTWIVAPACAFFMKVFNGTTILGRGNVLRARLPFVLVSNHVTLLDDFFIDSLLFLPRGMWQYRFIPHHAPEGRNFFRNVFIAFLMRRVKCIPIFRGRGVNQRGMREIIREIRGGSCIHIYPEGTRTRTGQLGRAKIGVGKIVYETKAKVIPVYHAGMEKILPIGAGIPRIGRRLRIAVGKPLNLKKYFAMQNTPRTWQLISNETIAGISRMKEKLEGWARKNHIRL